MGKYAKHKTNYLDCDALWEQYQPLIGSIYTKFSSYNGIFNCASDYEDLKAQITLEFVKLCREYDPSRGVDFPGYIKFFLQQRVYHHLTKLQRRLGAEAPSNYRSILDGDASALDFDNTIDLIDEETQRNFEKIDALVSLDWKAIISKNHKRLIEAILYESKTIEDLALQEGVEVKVIRLRLHFACERLRIWSDKQQEYEDIKNRYPNITFDDYLAYKKQMQRVKRTPIQLLKNTEQD